MLKLKMNTRLKKNLLKFVSSAPVLDGSDENMTIILSMLRFLQGRVFVFEHFYFHYCRWHVRHFDCLRGLPHEVHTTR